MDFTSKVCQQSFDAETDGTSWCVWRRIWKEVFEVLEDSVRTQVIQHVVHCLHAMQMTYPKGCQFCTLFVRRFRALRAVNIEASRSDNL